jgi:hypothetical protein
MPEAALARIAGAYALRAYLPASLAARTFRNTLRRLRGKAGDTAAAGGLAAAPEKPSDRVDRMPTTTRKRIPKPPCG